MKQLKKFCMTALCCGMLLGITALSVSANSTYMRGDANSDGKITVADVIAIQRNLLGGSTSHFSAEAADVDGKGLSLSDAIQVQRYIVGYGSNPYHIGTIVDKYELPFVPVG